MNIEWVDFQGRVTFVLGPDKHAGKTTFLKYALACLRQRGASLAYLSAGFDGEAHDHLSGVPKPVIRAAEGDHLVTAESALGRTDAQLEILEVFPTPTVLGRAVLVRVLRPGQIELIGLGNNRQLAEVLRSIADRDPARAVLVDGAVDRATQVSASAGEDHGGYVLTLRVNPANLLSSVNWLRMAWLARNIPRAGSQDIRDGFCLTGALTRGKLERIPKEPRSLVLDNFTSLFVGHREMAALCRERPVFFRETFTLRFIVVDLADLSRTEFLAALGSEELAAQLVFNPYLAERMPA